MKCRLCDCALKDFLDSAPPLSLADVTISKKSPRKIPITTCVHCRLVQLAAEEEAGAISQLYKNLEDTDFEGEALNRQASFERDLRKIHSHVPSASRILEIGAFTGNAVKPIVDFFPRSYYLGVEPSRWAASVAMSKGCNVVTGSVGTNLSEKNFDLIVSWDVIEHLERPHEMFEWIETLRGENTFLFLNTPNWNSPWRMIFRKNWWFIAPMHRTYFNRETLNKLAAMHGWSPVASWPHRKYRSLNYFADRLADTLNLPHFGRYLPKIKLVLQPGQMSCLFQKLKEA